MGIIEQLRSLAIPIDSLSPDPANARKHPEKNLEAIKASLRRFGQRKPIVVRAATMTVEAGNGTLEAAKALGWQEIAAVIIEDSATDAAGFAIADNRTAELAEWDDEQLSATLAALQDDGEDLGALGWDGDDLADVFHLDKDELASQEDDELPDAPPRCSPGEIWALGDHLLACGDSCSADVVSSLMQGAAADLVFTDPPYGVSYNRRGERDGIENDSLDFDGLLKFLKGSFGAWPLRPGGGILCLLPTGRPRASVSVGAPRHDGHEPQAHHYMGQGCAGARPQ